MKPSVNSLAALALPLALAAARLPSQAASSETYFLVGGALAPGNTGQTPEFKGK